MSLGALRAVAQRGALVGRQCIHLDATIAKRVKPFFHAFLPNALPTAARRGFWSSLSLGRGLGRRTREHLTAGAFLRLLLGEMRSAALLLSFVALATSESVAIVGVPALGQGIGSAIAPRSGRRRGAARP